MSNDTIALVWTVVVYALGVFVGHVVTSPRYDQSGVSDRETMEGDS